MSYLQIAGIVAGCLASGCIGVAIGCKVNGDRHETGVLSLAVGCVCALGSMFFFVL